MTNDREYFEARFSAITAQFGEMRAYIDTRIAEVKSELHQTTTQTIKWVAAIASATLALFVTLVAFVMNNAVPRTVPAPPQAAPAPIVIVIPPAALVQAPKP